MIICQTKFCNSSSSRKRCQPRPLTRYTLSKKYQITK
nr:MAG TPA: hypothetical protein [Caudoviricetes sp.]